MNNDYDLIKKHNQVKLTSIYSNENTIRNHSDFESISYSNDGVFSIFTSVEQDTLFLFNCLNLKVENVVPSKKYGATNGMFTNRNDLVIFSSSKLNDSIRLLSLENNSFVHYFQGHKNRVTQLVKSNNNSFISNSLDKSIRLWDYRSPAMQGYLSTLENSLVAFDNGTEFIFSVMYQESRSIKFYDLRTFHKGPLKIFRLGNTDKREYFYSMEYSRNGKYILLSSKLKIYIISSVELKIIKTIKKENESKTLSKFSTNADLVLTVGKDHINYYLSESDTSSEPDHKVQINANLKNKNITFMEYNSVYDMALYGNSEIVLLYS